MTYGPIRKLKETPGAGPNSRSFYKSQVYYRQRPPYVAALPYTMVEARASVGDAPNNAEVSACLGNVEFGTVRARSEALNQAYERFSSRIHDQASLAVAAMEYRQSIAMVSSRLMQIASALRSARRGRWNAVKRTLGVPSRYSFKTSSKNWSGRWLELHFGWVPLCGDIYSGIQALCGDLPSGGFSGRGNAPIYFVDSRRYDPGPLEYQREREYYGEIRAEIRAFVAIRNPNLYLANRAGLVNPLSVIWEITPWSFVIDWFSNVGSVLDSMTEFMGLELKHPSYTLWCKCTGTEFHRYRYRPDYTSMKSAGSACTIERKLGTYSPVFLPPFVQAFSLKRSVTAVSLVLQRLL